MHRTSFISCAVLTFLIAACGVPAQSGTGSGGAGGGSTQPDAQCLQDPVPAVGSPCGDDVECDFPWAVDACGNSDLDLRLACEAGSWVLVHVNLIGCELSCPTEPPVDGSTCDPAADGVHCAYPGEGETLIASCVGDGGTGGAPSGSGVWQVVSSDPGEPEDPPPGCALEDMSVSSPTGACEASYACNGDAWVIRCDSEDDGTGQSLCTCYVDEVYVDSPLVDGTGENACAAAAVSCIGA